MKTETRKKIRYLFLVLAVLWMCVIFYYSSRTAEESTEQSFAVGMMVGHILYPDFDNWDETERLVFAENADFAVRKTAHGMEYMLLAMLWFPALPVMKVAFFRYLIPWLIAVGYACTDEIHQMFVPGRAEMIRDVLIDSFGALLGVLLVFLINTIIHILSEKMSDNHVDA